MQHSRISLVTAFTSADSMAGIAFTSWAGLCVVTAHLHTREQMKMISLLFDQKLKEISTSQSFSDSVRPVFLRLMFKCIK